MSDQYEKYYVVNHQHDKIFRTVLDRKSDALALINKALNTQLEVQDIEKYNSSFINKVRKSDAIVLINKALNTQLEVQDIEKYNSSFINKVFQNREADIVYKIKDRSIFILIEHQTKVDYLMPYRILEYEVAIMQSAIDLDKIKNKESKIPLVISIVLYTGNKKWNAKKYLEENQEKIEGIENGLGNYNLIDINELTEKDLLEDNSFISKMMLIEKSKNTENIVEILEKIVKITKEEDKDTLRRIISIILEEKIGITKAKELIEKMEGDEGNMLAVVDMIRRENQMYIEIGKKEGELKEKIKIVTNMLKEKFNIETIQKITGINKEEIEKIAQNNNDN
ncbi:uncharacterized protein BN638_00218 [Clostridium sp. CAG:389]|nr:uncharacterized protein BN638_00218 [Clostridium sp. CAG:389]